jgi:arylsulfatase A-like enzyme
MKLRFLFLLFVYLAVPVHVLADTPVQKKPPNFIVILLDDLGLHDTGFMGNDFIETPAMDQLARDGVLFTQAYSNAPNCAPSRAAIMSGQTAQRTGVYTMMTGDMGDATRRKLQTPKNNVFLPEQVYTLAELLHDHGYVTAHIGKWNLGHGAVRGPEGQGFDVNIGGHRSGTATSYYAPYSNDMPNLQNAPAGEYLTDRLNSEVEKFISKNKSKPFFIYLSHYAPHFPIQAPRDTVKKYEAKREKFCGSPALLQYCEMTDYYPEYAAMVEHIDRGVAQLRAALKADGLADNTVIVLMSDNGGYPFARDPHELRGQKSQLYEGGIRVPMVWLVPGNMTGLKSQAGAKVDVPVSGVDIYPTFAALAGINTKQQTLDGIDISALITSSHKIPSRSLYWYFPAYTLDHDPEEPGGLAISSIDKNFSQIPAAVMLRDGWKLIRYYSSDAQGDSGLSELYYLPDDPLEKNNLFAIEKKRGNDMMRELEGWLQSTGGAVTLPKNPAYRPEK